MDPELERMGRGCFGKKRYEKLSQVERVAAEACGLCAGWHVSRVRKSGR